MALPTTGETPNTPSITSGMLVVGDITAQVLGERTYSVPIICVPFLKSPIL